MEGEFSKGLLTPNDFAVWITFSLPILSDNFTATVFIDLAKQIAATIVKALVLKAILSVTGLGATSAGKEAFGADQSFKGLLGGMLGGALICCVMMALMMSNAGGAWDNAKKFVEKGNFGGKGSEIHKAAVVGDTVGDPLKDTSGPSMNILINVMAIVSLVIAPLLIN